MATKKTAAKAPAKTAAKKSAPAKKTAAKAPASKAPASHQQIAELAHKYFAERGHSHGSHVSDWLRAEKELNG